MDCLLCHYEPDEKDGKHLPAFSWNTTSWDEISQESLLIKLHICKECVTRAKTVESFGLTVDELRIAAASFKERMSQLNEK